MKKSGFSRHTGSRALIALAIISLLLAACQPANAAITSQPPVQPSETALPAQPPTDEPAPTSQPTAALAAGEIRLDLSGLAQDWTMETVAAKPADAGEPYWEAAPAYRRVTLQGYPVTSHLMQPQIFIYPAGELAEYNQNAGQHAADLQALLQTRQPGERLPFLPLFNAQQVLHAQLAYVDFANGQGARFLTQFDQAPLPINNYELIYTFQGLTSDGAYYIAAVLPVNHPELPDSNLVDPQNPGPLNDFPAYLTETDNWLEQQPAASFTPDLTQLDALIQSLEVK